ncbi:MAG TPA: Crp/Fnr family transcriptional regulator [bacterium]|nr:Crp/Fnr family transcriptional regulator [bacterium]
MPDPAVFQQSPLFAHLSAGPLARLAALAQARRYAKDQVIFSEGDPGSALYTIVKGRIKIARSSLDGKERTIALLGRGDFFGELALLDGDPRSADAIAVEASEVLIVPREAFRGFLLEHPQVAMDLLVVLSRRLRRTSQIVHDAAFFDVRGRLARLLLELAQAEGQGASADSLVCPLLTQAELANMVGVTRESINKWLRVFVQQGAIARRRGRLVVTDPESLERELA